VRHKVKLRPVNQEDLRVTCFTQSGSTLGDRLEYRQNVGW
jgi:hypothetical protein